MAQTIEIRKLGINGEGIGYYNNTVVFIPNCLPLETVEIDELVEHKGYYTANVTKIIKRSPDRVIPQCPIFEKCQVCSIMPLKYDKQIEAKVEHLTSSINKYANKKVKVNNIVKANNQFYYRNTIKLPLFNYRDKLAIGIHFRDTNHYVHLKDCIVQDKTINSTINSVLTILDKYRYKAYDRKTKLGIRFLLVRAFGDEVMITFVIGKNTKIIDEAIEELSSLPRVKSINQTTNTKSSNEIIVEPIKNIVGKKSINVPFKNFTFKLSPESFMQLNIEQAIKMYDIIKKYAGTDNKMILDLYCGVGSITNYIHESSEKLVGIEINKNAIRDAKENAKKHRITNIDFISGDVDDEIKRFAKNRDIDVIIVDPPRVGLSDFTKESIIRSKTNKLIYVSCNPSTLGKDLATLLRYYEIKDISMVDMFPNTMHVETVVLMSRVEK